MGDRSGIDLNTVQIVASMGAAVTGAILTSYLGNGGTIVGTAVGAGASTAGFAVYKHYLARTKEMVAPVIVEHARQWTPGTSQPSTDQTAPGAARTRGTPDPAGRTVNSPNRAADAANGARAGQPQPTRPARTWDPGTPDSRPWGHTPDSSTRVDGTTPDPGQQNPGDDRTRDFRRPDLGRAGFGPAEPPAAPPFGTVRMGSTGHDGPGSDGHSDGGPGGPGGSGRHGRDGQAGGGRGLRGRPRWVVTVATSAAVFLVALLVVTLIEFGTGKPIDASVWGRKASGTTLGNVTGGHSNSGTVTPTASPTPTQSATPGGVGQTGPQSTSSATTTTAPTPSSVPSVSTAPSQGAPASVAPSNPGQQAPGQQTPGQLIPSQ